MSIHVFDTCLMPRNSWLPCRGGVDRCEHEGARRVIQELRGSLRAGGGPRLVLGQVTWLSRTEPSSYRPGAWRMRRLSLLLVFGSGYLFADDVMDPVRGDEELPV